MGNSDSINAAYEGWQQDSGDVDELREYITKNKQHIEEKNFKNGWAQDCQVLLKASEDGKEKIVEELIKAGADVTATDQEGRTAAMHACYEGKDCCCLHLLITARADLEATDNLGMTAAMHASSNGNDGYLRLLIAARADLEAKDNDGKTAAMWASANCSDGCLQLLIAARADLEAKDNDGMTAAMHAIYGGSDGCLQLLIAAWVDLEAKDNAGKTAVMHASANGSDGCLKLLIAARADLEAKDNEGKSATMIALESGTHWDGYICFLLLVKARVDLEGVDLHHKSDDDTTLVMHASEHGLKDAVEVLLAAGADVNETDKRGGTALHHACQKEHLIVAKLLLELMSSDAALALNKDGLSAIEVWGRDEEGGIRVVGSGGGDGGVGRGGYCGVGEDGKETLAAHIEAMFGGDVK